MTRPRLLLAAPYGMGLRNLAFNPVLWNGLVSMFDVDVVTPVTIQDPQRLGIRRVVGNGNHSFAAGLAHGPKRAALTALFEFDRFAFFMFTNEAETYRGVYHAYQRRGISPRLPFFAWLSHSAGGPALRQLLLTLGATRFPGDPPLGGYEYVFLTHASESMCVSTGLRANAAGIPVICAPLAVDNLMHGPMMFRPDLLLLWGEEQRHDYERQVAFNPALRGASCAIVGSPIHDVYLAADPSASIDNACGLRADDRVILFAAHMDVFTPFQRDICDIAVEFARSSGRSIKVLVRVRPGVDEPAWETYQRARADVVRLQIPQTAGYDKSGFVANFDAEADLREVTAFAATMRRADMLLIPSLSTMSLDAMLFGVPVVSAAFDPGHPQAVLSDAMWYRATAAKMPPWKDLRVTTARDELLDAFHDVFDRGRAAEYCSETYFAYRATARDGRAGVRTLDALRAFVAARPETSPHRASS